MFFYRGKSHKTPRLSNTVLRLATAVALVGYPLGGVIQILFPDTTPEPGLTAGEFAGFAFMIAALLAFCVIAPSHLQRIVGEERKHLDEFEMDLRRKAYTFSYWVLSSLVVLFAIYMALSADSDGEAIITLWVPSTYDHWNALFWGTILYAVVLPTTYLAWAGPAPLDDDGEDLDVAREQV